MNAVDNEKIYAVLDIGSTYISGMIASKHKNGCVSPIAKVKSLATETIVHGCVHNIDNTVEIINNIKESLEKSLPRDGSIEKFYVGLSCRSMHTRMCEVSLDLGPMGSLVTLDHLLELRKQVDLLDFDGYGAVMVIDPKFFIDGKREVNPKGVKCSKLKAQYQIILVRKNLLDDIKYVLESRVNVEIAGIIANPVAEAHVSLNSEDFTLGCAFVNIGGGSTSISIFKERLLSHMYIIPVGGHNVTKDLMSLKLMYSNAENLKKSAEVSLDTDIVKDKFININAKNGLLDKTLPLKDVNNIICARMSEIVFNVISIIKELGCIDDLSADMVFAGGGSKISGFGDYLKNIGVEYRFAEIRKDLLDESITDQALLESITLIGLVSMASDNCIEYNLQNLEELMASASADDDMIIEEDDAEGIIYTSQSATEPIIDESWANDDDESFTSIEDIDKRKVVETSKKKGFLKRAFNNFYKMLEGSEE